MSLLINMYYSCNSIKKYTFLRDKRKIERNLVPDINKGKTIET